MQTHSRLPELPPSRTDQFGLLAWLESTRVRLPLKGVECRFRVSGDLLDVELDQIFHQDNGQPLDCLYTFPLAAGAAVYRCELHINGRVVSARIEELERAVQLVKEKKAEGHRTALVQMERDNLFTLEVGNIAPGDLVVVRFAYFQTITRLGQHATFHIPFCPGVRYIPGEPLLRSNRGRGTVDDTTQVPDASRISPPRMDQLDSDAAYLAVEGRIDHSPGKIGEVQSPSHPLLVKDDEGFSSVRMADRGAVPDCDLTLRWVENSDSALGSAAWVSCHGTDTHALVRLVAPEETAAAKEYAQDIYFLVDRSGSMAGTKWSKACEAFRAFLRNLEPQDRVWATFYEDRQQDLAEKPMPPGALLADPAVQTIEKVGTGGGTELLPALRHVVAALERHSKRRNAAVILITDGQVGNEAEIVEVMRELPHVRMHTFGIDTAVNDGFLRKLATQNRGTCHLASPNDDIVATVSALGARLRRPVLTDIRVRGSWQSAEPSVPDLHGGETLNLALRASSGAGEIEWEGKQPDGTLAVFRCASGAPSAPAVRLLWAQRRITYLLSDEQVEEAHRLAREHNLLCEGMAFVAWDSAERVVGGQAKLEVYQPSMRVKKLAGKTQAMMPSYLSAAPRASAKAMFCAMGEAAPTMGAPSASLYMRLSGRMRDTVGKGSEPLIRSISSCAWRSALEHNDWLNRQEMVQELLDWLEQWSLAEPANRTARERKLEELAERLRASPSAEALRAWLEVALHDQPEFLSPVRAILDRMAAAPVT